MSIENKLRSIIDIKSQIKNAISEKGVIINNDTPFSEYPLKIASILNSSVDEDAPIIEEFVILVNIDKSAHMSGKTEVGSFVILKDPNGTIVPLEINIDGTFETTINESIEGIYILTVSDAAGNITTEYREVVHPVLQVDDRIKSIFDSGSSGLWYDPNDFSTMFQDVDMKIPITSVGQSVSVIVSKNNNGAMMSALNASKCPILQYNNTTKNHYLLYDGIDDCFSVASNNSISIDSQYATVFNSYVMLRGKSSSFQLINGLMLIRGIISYGLVQYSISYNGLTYTLIPLKDYTYPHVFSLALELNANGKDKYSINGEVTYSDQKTITNFKNMSFRQMQSTSDCLNQEFYGLLAFDKKLSDTDFKIIETYIGNKAGATFNA